MNKYKLKNGIQFNYCFYLNRQISILLSLEVTQDLVDTRV